MRIAIVYFADKNNNFINLVKGIEKGIIDNIVVIRRFYIDSCHYHLFKIIL